MIFVVYKVKCLVHANNLCNFIGLYIYGLCITYRWSIYWFKYRKVEANYSIGVLSNAICNMRDVILYMRNTISNMQS